MPDAPRLRIAREGAVAVLWIENPPRNLLRGPGHGRMVAPLAEGRAGRDEPRPRRVLGARAPHEADGCRHQRGGPRCGRGTRARVRPAHRRRECDLLAPGGGPRMDAESRCDREALEDRRPLEGARNPSERKRGESTRCPSTGNRQPSRLSRRRVRPGKGPGDHVRLEASLGGEGDQARADGGRREALPQPLPPGVATRDPALVDRRAQSRDGAAPRETVLSTRRGPRIQPCRKIVSFAPQRFSSMSTPTSVATNDPFLRRAAFRILRRSSSSAKASSDRKNPKSISTRELTRTAPTSREPLSRTRPTIEVRRPRTRFRKPKQTTRPSAHSPARTFVYESRGSRP